MKHILSVFSPHRLPRLRPGRRESTSPVLHRPLLLPSRAEMQGPFPLSGHARKTPKTRSPHFPPFLAARRLHHTRFAPKIDIHHTFRHSRRSRHRAPFT